MVLEPFLEAEDRTLDKAPREHRQDDSHHNFDRAPVERAIRAKGVHDAELSENQLDKHHDRDMIEIDSVADYPGANEGADAERGQQASAIVNDQQADYREEE